MSDLRELISERLENREKERANERLQPKKIKPLLENVMPLPESRLPLFQPSKLSQEQLENWRKFLSTKFGVFASLLSDYEIQTYKDNLQMQLDTLQEEDNK